MIHRVTETAEMNDIVNAKLGHMAPELAAVDFSEFTAIPQNIVLQKGENFSVFEHVDGNTYSGHYLFGPETRGAAAKALAEEMLAEMFTTHGASVICGLVSRQNRAARLMTRCLGFIPRGESLDALGRECLFYILERDVWASRQS